MFGDIYPMKYMGKQLIRLEGWNIGYHTITYAASRESKELLMLLSDFMVNSTLKGISVDCMECLNKDA